MGGLTRAINPTTKGRFYNPTTPPNVGHACFCNPEMSRLHASFTVGDLPIRCRRDRPQVPHRGKAAFEKKTNIEELYSSKTKQATTLAPLFV